MRGEGGQFGSRTPALDLGAHDIAAVVEHPGDGRVDLRFDPQLLRGENR